MADFEVKCECGKALDAEFFAIGNAIFLKVTPCDWCLSTAKDEGYKEKEQEG